MANNVEEGVVVVGDESRKAKRLHLRWSTICLVHPHLALLSIQIVGGPQNLTILFVFCGGQGPNKFWQTNVQILAYILAVKNWVWEPDDTFIWERSIRSKQFNGKHTCFEKLKLFLHFA